MKRFHPSRIVWAIVVLVLCIGGSYFVADSQTFVNRIQGMIGDGSAVTGFPIRVGGKDGSGNTQDIITDASGELQVDVLTVPSDPFGVNADSASATGSISAKLRFIASTGIPITGTVTVGSHAVTNAGTFVVQENGAALTALQLIDNIVLAEDAAAVTADPGVQLLAVRASSPANTSGANGDYEPLQVNAGRLWASATIDAALPAGNNNVGDVDIASIAAGNNNIGDVDVATLPGNFAEDAAHTSTDQGHFVLGVRRDANTTFVSADGDYSPFSIDANGNLKVNVVAGGTAGTQFAEDVAHTTGDVGTLSLAVRRDANTTFVSTDGDYSPLSIDANGNLKVNIIAGAGSGGTAMTDDAAFTAATTSGTPMFAMFDNTSPDSVDENDGGIVRMSANRNLFVNLRDAAGNERGLNIDANNNLGAAIASIAAGNNNIGDVDIASIVPGTGATNEGKAVDSVAGSTDTGVAALAVRDDATATLTPADGDYTYLRVNARGALWVDLETRLDRTNDGVNVAGVDAADAAVSVNPIYTGARGSTALPTAMSADGDAVGIWASLNGAVNIIPRSNTGATTIFAEDAAHTSTDFGYFSLAVRRDANTTFASADGDYTPFSVDANGNLKVNVIAGGTAGTQFAEDAAHTTADVGTFALAVRHDTSTTGLGADGDYAALAVNSSGRLYVAATIDAAIPAGTNNIGDVDIVTMPGTAVEDAAETAGGTGVMILGVRRDTAASSATTDGDNATLNLSSTGRLWVDPSGVTLTVASHAVTNAGTFVTQENGAALTALQLIDNSITAEDVASAAADGLTAIAAIRRDTPVANANVGADGDYTNFLLDNLGKLWTADNQAEDAAHASGDRGSFALALRTDTLAASSGTTGDYEGFHTTALGGLWVTQAPNAAGGLTIFRSLDLDETEEDVKTSAGQMYGYFIYNNAASTKYVKIYNATAANVTVGSTTPVLTIPIPAGSAANWSSDIGIAFDTAICAAATNAVADADTGAPAANDIVIDVYYK